MTTPAATVVIPHYNDVARLEKCLGALAASQPAGIAATVDILVVDNGSTHPLEAVRAAHPSVRFLNEPAKGAAAARNRGVAGALAERIFFLDADCVPAPDWLARALDVAPSADLVGGRIDTFDETPPPRSGAQAFETVFAFNQRDYIERKGFSVTANLLTTRTIFRDVGDMVVGRPEDKDWCERAVARGYRLIYDDRLRVEHPTRTDWPALARKWRRLVDEAHQQNGTGGTARLKWLAQAGAVALSPFAHAPQVLRHPRLSGGERLSAIVTLFRLRWLRCLWMIRQALA
jgi:GT2 family glycosyltransferase